MSNGYTVSDLIADFLEHLGVETAFGIVSVHNIPMLNSGRRTETSRGMVLTDS